MKYDVLKMTAEEIAEAFNCQMLPGGMLSASPLARDYAKEMRARKAEVLEYLANKVAAKKAAQKDRQSKIDAIEGLAEIKKAVSEYAEFCEEFNRRMENEALSGILPAAPKADIEALKTKYPRAAAYLKAENWSYASHYIKAGAGKKALERIINGEDYSKALADAEAEWSSYCEEHIFD